MRRAATALAYGGATLALTGVAVATAEAGGTSLSPHRAVYEITLARSAPGSGVAELSGRMVYELAGSACEGFTQNMRFVTRLTNRDGEAQVSDLRTSSWEDSAGKRLRFNSSQYRDERLEDATQGDAGRAPGSATVRVELTKPEKRKIDLASGVYFPVQHTTALLATAREGRSVFLADLYDGSEKGDKVYQTSAFIGQRAGAGKVVIGKEADAAGVLDALPSWPIAISYYEPGGEKTDALPAYELSFRLFDNGVSSRLFIDYGDFAIIGELKELKLLEANECKR